ncbi:actin-associated protein FAM107A isoform X3 [Engystomops pustulosus]|uniref:actin-associated protein FAM107A isoform X3 n=1 Tax=Engystomops pustulosus TaxID=76066 RepID=UPI003AFB4075
MGAAHGKKKEYSLQAKFHNEYGKHVINGSASMYSDIQREPPDLGSILAHPDYLESNTELIKPKKLLNPVKASRSHQELHRELLMNHRRGLSIDKKPELQRVLENRRRDKIIQQKRQEEESKKMQSPFEQELLKRQQRLEQVALRSIQVGIKESAGDEAVFGDMKLLLALSVCYGLVFHITHSAFVKKTEAAEFLAVVGRKHAGGRPCSLEACDHESSEDIDESNLRMRAARRLDSSSSESAMAPQIPDHAPQIKPL